MEVVDAQGNKTPLRPPWTVVLGYELECRKHAFECVREDQAQLSEALMDSIKNSELKENSFTSPIALMSRGGGKGQGQRLNGHADDGAADDRPTKRPRGARPKGRGGGKGQDKGRGRGGGQSKGQGKGGDLVSTTPDGRQICFSYSSPSGCSSASCARVHVCRVRGCNAAHPTADHPP